MSERQGVEIDYCPQCRGVWLDRGELDKIIEKSTAGSSTRDEEYRQEKKDYKDDSYKGDSYRDDSYKDQNDPNYRRKKKGGFLSDLFDFD
jgi:Zn-finger nucleic acid-binding protein